MRRRIQKLLVANRGEIAIRIILAAREMGISTVAVLSEADRASIQAGLADEAIVIGPSEASKSYLDADAILDAARSTGADAVHPGYGFLSERFEFAEACEAAGLVFVGPSAAAMRRLGSKIEAKSLAVKIGVPIVPGHFEPGSTRDDLKLAADSIGYPILLKASAGGGGRGMRQVASSAEFDAAFRMAESEAIAAFGNGELMVERLISRPRHVEVQILADMHGNVVCLYERECSIQRRHQKMIEEAPSPMAGFEEMWPAMRDAAKRLISSAEYVGAGTVEFIVDQSAGAFYFLEVNARLQVEHPVTEAISGIDLVKWQLRIAMGETLQVTHQVESGDRLGIHGHAIEARIVAEDPARDFMPSTGLIREFLVPTAPGVRVDTGFRKAAEVTRYYDSLIAKVIAHGETREDAIHKLRCALREFHVVGPATNIAFVLDVLDSAEFRNGALDTGLLERSFSEWTPGPVPDELGSILAARTLGTTSGAPDDRSGVQRQELSWNSNDGFRNTR